jgi:hypothetical protein
MATALRSHVRLVRKACLRGVGMAGLPNAILRVWDPHPSWRSFLSPTRRAYVEARYNPGYKITKEQLEYLAQRVKKLQDLTKKICEARIEAYLSP